MSETFLDYAVRMYDDIGQRLYELPDWAWWRRRKLMRWRHYYAMRVADEMVAATPGLPVGLSAAVPESSEPA